MAAPAPAPSLELTPRNRSITRYWSANPRAAIDSGMPRFYLVDGGKWRVRKKIIVTG